MFLSFLPPILSSLTHAGQSGSEARRAAFENVGDVNLGSGDVYAGEQPVEEKTEPVEKSAESPPDKKGAPFAAIIGNWEMGMDVNGSTREATLSLSIKDDQLSGKWRGRRRESELSKLVLEGNRLTFERTMGEGRTLRFSGTISGDRITGTYSTPFGEISCTGTRVKKKHSGARGSTFLEV